MWTTPDDGLWKVRKRSVQPETKTLISKLERVLIKLYRQNVSLLFNQTCLNERLLANYTYLKIYDPAAHPDTDTQIIAAVL